MPFPSVRFLLICKAPKPLAASSQKNPGGIDSTLYDEEIIKIKTDKIQGGRAPVEEVEQILLSNGWVGGWKFNGELNGHD